MVPPALGPNSDWSPMAVWADLLSIVWSPYDNPFYVNLLSDVIDREIPDFGALNDPRTPHLFVCATNVKTNQRKIFGPGDHGVAALTASACLPTVFRSVDVKGEFYWDGGYLGNPALFPLRSPSLSADLLIVWVNPLNRHDEHAHQHDIGLDEVRRGKGHPGDAVAGGDHLGADQHGDADPDRHSQSGEDSGKARRQQHAPEDSTPARAQ